MFAARQTSGADLCPRPTCDAKVRCRRTARDGGCQCRSRVCNGPPAFNRCPLHVDAPPVVRVKLGMGAVRVMSPAVSPLRNRPSKFRNSARRRCPEIHAFAIGKNWSDHFAREQREAAVEAPRVGLNHDLAWLAEYRVGRPLFSASVACRRFCGRGRCPSAL